MNLKGNLVPGSFSLRRCRQWFRYQFQRGQGQRISDFWEGLFLVVQLSLLWSRLWTGERTRGISGQSTELSSHIIVSLSLLSFSKLSQISWMLMFSIPAIKSVKQSYTSISNVLQLQARHHLSGEAGGYFYKKARWSTIQHFIAFIDIYRNLEMRKGPFVVETSTGQLQLTKGSFLTLSKRRQQPKSKQKKAIVKEKQRMRTHVNVEPVSMRTRNSQRSIRNQYYRARESHFAMGMETDQETTWSNINFAVYSLSLSLSAANYDYNCGQYM